MMNYQAFVQISGKNRQRDRRRNLSRGQETTPGIKVVYQSPEGSGRKTASSYFKTAYELEEEEQ